MTRRQAVGGWAWAFSDYGGCTPGGLSMCWAYEPRQIPPGMGYTVIDWKFGEIVAQGRLT